MIPKISIQVFSVLAFILLFFIFYPAMYAFRDESSYLAMSYILREGVLFIDQTDIPIHARVQVGTHLAPMYGLGLSVFLIPFTFLGWQTIFIFGLGCHLLGAYFLKKIADLFEIESPFLLILYLFYPAFILFSRTVMSDIPSMTLFLAGTYFYFKPGNSKALAGMFMGFNVFFRITNALLAVPFGLMLLFQAVTKKGGWKDLVSFSMAIIPFFGGALALNSFLYGSPFLTGYSKELSGVTNFGWLHFERNLPHYLISLFLIYPLMFFLAFFSKVWRKPEIIVCGIFLLLFYSFYYFHDHFPHRFGDYIFGTRFLFPVIPFFILGYAEVLGNLSHKFFPGRGTQIAAVVLCLFCMMGAIGIHLLHQQRLNDQRDLKDLIYEQTETGSLLVYDRNAGELIQSVWGDRDYQEFNDQLSMHGYFKNWNQDRPAYIVKRDTFYGGAWNRRIWEPHLAEVREIANLEKIVEKKGLIIYKVTRKQ